MKIKAEHIIRGVGILMVLYLLAFLLIGMAGCKSVERYKASSRFPADCAQAFPVKKDTTYIPGRPDTVQLPGLLVDCDSVAQAFQAQYRAWQQALSTRPADTIFLPRPTMAIKCPPSTHTTRVDTTAITAESTARLEACQRAANEAAAQASKDLQQAQAAIDTLQKELDRRTKQRNRAGIWAGVATVATAFLFFLLKIKRR